MDHIPHTHRDSIVDNSGYGNQFNAFEAPQYNNTAGGNQFNEVTFNGPVNIAHPVDAKARRIEAVNSVLRILDTSPYRDRKNRNPDRVQGTCKWFESHKLFSRWKESNRLKMLWVSADPGCGKSVLVKHLVDNVLQSTESTSICYFFFKDDFADQRSVVSAISCILRQLFIWKPNLLSNAILDQFEIGGKSLMSSFEDLWQILVTSAENNGAGQITCILDAIDECESEGRAQLAEALYKLYNTQKNLRLKFLLTSRPYETIRRSFHPFEDSTLPVIHLSGESSIEAEKIAYEIDLVIKARVQDITLRQRLTKMEEELLTRQIMRVPNRTYLWAHLTLDLVESDIGVDRTRILHYTSQLPKKVDEAYDRILSKSYSAKKAKRLLNIIVAAARPLTLKEMAMALSLSLKGHRQSYHDLSPEPEDRFKQRLRDLCGLVKVVDSRLYPIHQTVKEFLVPMGGLDPIQDVSQILRWKHSLRPHIYHSFLAGICIKYLLLEEFRVPPLLSAGSLAEYVADHIFLDYCANHWAGHFRQLRVEKQEIMAQSALEVCEIDSKTRMNWFRVYWTSSGSEFPTHFTPLMTASYLGLESVLRCLMRVKGIDLNIRDWTYGRSAISWAAENGFADAVMLLIRGTGLRSKILKLPIGRRAKVNSEDHRGRTPLTYAVWSRNMDTIEALVDAGADAYLEDHIGGSPFSYAICNGQEEVINLLYRKRRKAIIEKNIETKLLFSTVVNGDERVTRLILKTGKANAGVKNESGQTPLSIAIWYQYEDLIRLLIQDSKVDVESKDGDGETALFHAVLDKNEAIIRLLIQEGKADVEARDKNGETPLFRAVRNGHEAIVRLLIQKGKADIEAKDMTGRTPLFHAIDDGNEAIVRLLVREGKADVEMRDKSGQTPLLYAARHRNQAITRLLIEEGKADVKVKDKYGRTLRSYLADS